MHDTEYASFHYYYVDECELFSPYQTTVVYMYAFHGICIKYNYMCDICETFFRSSKCESVSMPLYPIVRKNLLANHLMRLHSRENTVLNNHMNI